MTATQGQGRGAQGSAYSRERRWSWPGVPRHCEPGWLSRRPLSEAARHVASMPQSFSQYSGRISLVAEQALRDSD